jgi:hypothetical protein
MICSAEGRARVRVRIGPIGRRRRAGVAPVLVAAALLVPVLTGCSGRSAAASSSAVDSAAPASVAAGSAAAGAATVAASSATASPVAGSAVATKALETSAGQVRSQVEAVAQPLQTITATRLVDVDDSGPCQVGDPGPWPRRWSFAVRLALRTTDAPAAAKAVGDRLTAQGWTVAGQQSAPDSLDFDAHKGGLVLHVGGEPNPATVTVEGYGPCIGSDGKPRAG